MNKNIYLKFEKICFFIVLILFLSPVYSLYLLIFLTEDLCNFISGFVSILLINVLIEFFMIIVFIIGMVIDRGKKSFILRISFMILSLVSIFLSFLFFYNL